MRTARALAAVTVLPVLLAIAPAASAAPVEPAAAKKPRSAYVAAPAYPDTRLAITVKGTPTVNSVATVVVSGSVTQADPDLPIDYTLSLFVQDPAVVGPCPRSYADELQNVINLGGDIAHIARGLDVGADGRFAKTVRYRTGSLRRIQLCAYVRYITDDAAVSSLRWTLAPRPKAKPRRSR
ncbi:hypothetical protein [Motilibacter aurantiacus]|uniref:hypothetical protein n=1 Tax=Motilibacter aurantiacus TaxID=2714955 RepID=UPI001408D75B|nr:hypothetical protein [Motilibacter aurantiacus]NHC46818.1 hypothetical protein [Motilibacter aurantiacus]